MSARIMIATVCTVLVLQGCATPERYLTATPADVAEQGPPPPADAPAASESCGRACRFLAFLERHPWAQVAGAVLLIGAIAALDDSDTGKCLNGKQVVTVPAFACGAEECTEVCR